MFKLFKNIHEKRIKSMINKEFNKKIIDEALKYLEQEIEKIESEIIPLENDASLLARSESLIYTLNEKTLCFNKKDRLDTMAYYSSEVEKIINDDFIENKALLNSITNSYKALKPKLIELKGLRVYYDIIKGKNLFNAFLEENNFDNKSRADKRKITQELRNINGLFYERTGLYFLEERCFGDKDVDGNIKTAIVLKDEWVPYSKSYSLKENEYKIIEDNQDLLELYKELYLKNNQINATHLEYIRNINRQKELRHRTINEIVSINSKDSLIRR